jgi:putative hemolysin
MSGEPSGSTTYNVLIGVLLMVGSAFFVGAEYASVSMRKPKLEGLAKQGNKGAKGLLKMLENLSPVIAGTQIGITMVGVAMGSVTEPFVSHHLKKALTWMPEGVASLLSFILVLFVLVVVGELVPKYLALTYPERFMLIFRRPIDIFVKVFGLIIWCAEICSGAILKLFKIDIKETGKEKIQKDELIMLVNSTKSDGTLDAEHANMVSRALKLDVLDARDVMVHRLDIHWIDVSSTIGAALHEFARCRHSRLLACDGDIDEVTGVIHLVDVIRVSTTPDATLASIIRPIIAVPENLTIERMVNTMREQKSKILLVRDEYGGTSGLVTSEDVFEEVFGELEDGPESERPALDIQPNGRVSARAELRFDEVVNKLGLDVDPGEQTDTLADLIVDELQRVPRTGDQIETSIGTLIVENMARRRITRVGIHLKEANPTGS